MDKGDLFNLALSYLGDRAYKAGSPAAIACDAVGQHCIHLALDYARWTFATRRVVLPLVDRACELPTDCLRVQKVELPKFGIYGRTVVDLHGCNKEVVLVYTSDEMAQTVSVPDNEPMFCEAVALLIAAKVAPRIACDLGIAQALEQRAYQQLAQAKYKDAVQVDSNDQMPENHLPLLD